MGVLVRICQKLSRKFAQTIPACTYRKLSTFHGSIDRYNGVTIKVKDNISPSMSVEDFQNLLKGNYMFTSIFIYSKTYLMFILYTLRLI
jgi:hypothetical protein